MTWALTTVVKVLPDPYTENIWPLTRPLFEQYADRQGLDFVPTLVTHAACSWMDGTIAGNLGTSAVYASFPARRALLDDYEGVIYLDQDAVILDMDRDLTKEVTPAQPVGMVPGLTGALQVLLSGRYTKELIDWVWAKRENWMTLQWAEEGAFKYRFGWEHDYSRGDPAQFVHETPDTARLHLIQFGLRHPLDTNAPPGRYFASNPAGVQPLSRRLEVMYPLLEEAAKNAIHGL